MSIGKKIKDKLEKKTYGEAELFCAKCGKTWTQKKVEFISDVSFICPKCHTDDDVWTKRLDFPNGEEDKELVLGKGGCGTR